MPHFFLKRAFSVEFLLIGAKVLDAFLLTITQNSL